MKITDFKNLHKGKKFYVFGLGPSLKNIKEVESDAITIGVNDIAAHFTPKYTVCIDRMRSFSPERFQHIQNSKSIFFTQYKKEVLPINGERVEIDLMDKRGIIDLDANSFSISYCSPFVAGQLAYYMGASEIVFVGVDLNNHQLKNKMTDMRSHFNHLKFALENRGVRVISMSDPEGALNSYDRI